MRRISLLLTLTVLGSAFAGGAALANCGAEGCPLAPQGAEFSGGRFSFDMSEQAYTQNHHWNGTHEIAAAEALAIEGGLGHIVEQETDTRMWTLQAHGQLLPRLRVDLSLPYLDRVHRHELAHHRNYFIPSEWHMTGLGDGSVVGSYTLLPPRRLAASTIIVQAGIKLPTGQTHVDEVAGETPESAVRPGSGSTDLLAGLQFRAGLGVRTLSGQRATAPLTAALSLRWNGRGTDAYRMGDEWDLFLGSAYPLTQHLRVTGQMSATGHARDEAGNTDAEPHSTGSLAVYAAPGLLYDLGPGLSVFGSQQLRMYEHTNGPQLVSPYHLTFGLRYALR